MRRIPAAVLLIFALARFTPLTWSAGESADELKSSNASSVLGPMQIQEARERARLLHDLVHDTLLVVHEEYYREDEGLTLPAAAFRDVFDRFQQRQGVTLRWLAVDVEPMNLDHEPRTEFEKAAREILKGGQPFHEELTEKAYQYAGGIRLTSECLKCHVPNRTSLRDRLAGLVIEMPLEHSVQNPAADAGR
jgi:hypothetical protein